jgi:transcriptional accessory protein Tex/SPT6
MEKQALDELKINAIKEAINLFKVNLDKNIDQESIIKKSINSLKQTA